MTNKQPGTNLSEMLTDFILRIESVEEEIRGLQEGRKEIYAEAKEAEIAPVALRKIVAERRMAVAERNALNETLDQYRHALGMLSDLPLGVAATAKRFADGMSPGDFVQFGNTPPLVKQADGTIKAETKGRMKVADDLA